MLLLGEAALCSSIGCLKGWMHSHGGVGESGCGLTVDLWMVD